MQCSCDIPYLRPNLIEWKNAVKFIRSQTLLSTDYKILYGPLWCCPARQKKWTWKIDFYLYHKTSLLAIGFSYSRPSFIYSCFIKLLFLLHSGFKSWVVQDKNSAVLHNLWLTNFSLLFAAGLAWKSAAKSNEF